MTKLTECEQYYAIAQKSTAFAGSHAIHTPRALVEEILGKLPLSGEILVLFNVEFVISLVYTYGIDPVHITFYSDHQNKVKLLNRFAQGTKYLDTLDNNNMNFDVVVGNPPYSINNSGDGRTSGTKTRLYATFYKSFFEKAPNYGIVIPSNWIGRQNDSVRKSIMNDPGVQWIIDTSEYFNDQIKGTPTCAVIRNNDYNSTEKSVLAGGVTRSAEASSIVSLDTQPSASVVNKLTTNQQSMSGMWCRNVNTGITRSCSTLTDQPTQFPVVLVTGAAGSEPTMGFVSAANNKQKHTDSIKVIMNTNASPSSIGAIKIVPAPAYTTDSIVFFPAATLAEAQSIKLYLESAVVRFIVAVARNSHGNSKSFFSLVPRVSFARSWTDAELYAHFNLTQDEIDLIEATVK